MLKIARLQEYRQIKPLLLAAKLSTQVSAPSPFREKARMRWGYNRLILLSSPQPSPAGEGTGQCCNLLFLQSRKVV